MQVEQEGFFVEIRKLGKQGYLSNEYGVVIFGLLMANFYRYTLFLKMS